MADTDNFEARKALAIAAGWTCTQIGEIYLVESPDYVINGKQEHYSWFDQYEYFAWYELLMDAELYDEITARIGGG